MAFSGLSGLINSISGSVTGFFNNFANLFRQQSSRGLYPIPAIAKVLTQNGTVNGKNWNKSIPYVFSVVKEDGTRVSVFGDFELPINPSEIQQDELPAITIQPTQGGTAVNHSGNRYKDLVISGTTGVSPNRGAGGVQSTTGKAIGQPDDLKHASGHEVFIELRNWFKAYYEFKKENSAEAKSARMVFKNFKDGEFLIIEVPKFSMRRSASSPMLYNYTISARVLGVLDFKKPEGPTGFFGNFDEILTKANDAIDTARGVFLQSQNILRQIESTYDNILIEPMRKTALALKAFLGLPTTAADLGQRGVQDTLSTKDTIAILLGIKKDQDSKKNSGTLDPRIAQIVVPSNLENTVGEAGPSFLLKLPGDSLMALPSSSLPFKAQTSIQADQQAALELPRTFFEELKENIIRIQDNAQDFFNLNDSVYDSQFERTPTLQAEATKRVTDAEFQLLAAFDKAIEGINLLLSTNAMFKSSYADRIQQVNDTFNNELNVVPEKAVKEIFLNGQTSLERLALENLGDSSRWIEIVELNNLKPPYISQDPQESREGVKKVGDKIMIPQPVIFGFSNTPVNRQSFLTQDLTEVEKNLGIDLKLNQDFDLELNNRGDLNLVRGADNAAQAIIFKLGLEKGEIIDHPEIGIGLVIGDKAPSVVQVQSDLLQTLSQDPRFEKILNMSIQRENNTYRVRFYVKLKNIDTPVPVDFKV